MSFYALFPLVFLKFWYIEAPVRLLSFFLKLNKAFFHMVSLPLMIKTFFKPWKNEYRKGLVGFSRGMAMFVKTVFIFGDLILLFLLLTVETLFFFGFLLWPIGTILVLFI